MERTLAVGATGGSISALVLRLLTGLLSEPLQLDCPLCLEGWHWEQLDLPSVALGLVVGLLLGPLLDLVQLIRQSWKVWLGARLRALERSEGQQSALYKLV